MHHFKFLLNYKIETMFSLSLFFYYFALTHEQKKVLDKARAGQVLLIDHVNHNVERSMGTAA